MFLLFCHLGATQNENDMAMESKRLEDDGWVKDTEQVLQIDLPRAHDLKQSQKKLETLTAEPEC